LNRRLFISALVAAPLAPAALPQLPQLPEPRTAIALWPTPLASRPQYYRLEYKTPVPCSSVLEWAQAMEGMNRQVAEAFVGPFRVSTVFLGLDHAFLYGPPLIFETMVFRCNADQSVADWSGEDFQERCSTWDEALEMHARGMEWSLSQLSAPIEEAA
jgi:hypothetical protein